MNIDSARASVWREPNRGLIADNLSSGTYSMHHIALNIFNMINIKDVSLTVLLPRYEFPRALMKSCRLDCQRLDRVSIRLSGIMGRIRT